MQILEHLLKIRREKEKHEFSQTVGNHLALRNFLFALRNLQCGFRIAKFRIAKFAVVFRIAKFAMWFFALRNSQCGFRIAKFRIAKFAVVFRIAKFATPCEQFAN